MTTWDSATQADVTAPEEVELSTRRRDGSVRSPRTIWIVPVDGRVFIRSTNGREADWFRWALATGAGRLAAGGQVYDVSFAEAAESDLAQVDAAYRRDRAWLPSR